MGDIDTQPGQEAAQILERTLKWTEKCYDWTNEEIEGWIDSQGADCNGIIYIEYDYHQIGKSEKWFENISRKIGNPLTVRREILLQRIHGSSLSPYDREDIEYIIQCQQKPIDELWLLDYYKFDIYTKLNKGTPYIVGVDCSTGTLSDNNAITILDPYTVKPVAEFKCSFIGETKYEQLLMELCKVLPRCVLCIERNSIGDGIIDHLLHSPVASRLYYDKAKDAAADNMKSLETVESMLKKNMTLKTYYGVWTGTQSRETMFAILGNRVNGNKEDFVTANIIEDLSRLIMKPSSKIEAAQGSM